MGPLDREITIKDITDAVSKMPKHKGLLTAGKDGGVKSVLAQEIKVVYLLMHWPLFSMPGCNLGDGEEQGISLYAAILPHGKTHVAEIFFADEKTGKYLGSHMDFSIDFPDNKYLEDYDPWLMEELAGKVLGVHREKTMGHNLMV